LNVRCLRIANAFGPGHTKTTQGIIPNLLKAALTQQPLPVWGDGSVVRDYVYVKDVARAFRMAAAYDGDEMVFNIATGRGHSVLEVADVVRTTTGLPLNLMLEPARPIDVPINILAIARARRELDWYPLFSLERGIAETWRSMERQIS
jgi:UDP-glucose 4-epimerase